KAIRRGIEQELAAQRTARDAAGSKDTTTFGRDELIKMLEESMLEAADKLEFERAAELRDRIERLEAMPEDAPDMPVESAGSDRTSAGRHGSRTGRTGGKGGRPR
ncbi:MAG: UvrB/UvrC motif-containing protein, partial [Phycisphaerales bacterium]|nr:UvrB/UvrC motif-containing protein [Phycisphaerales bacterium]